LVLFAVMLVGTGVFALLHQHVLLLLSLAAQGALMVWLWRERCRVQADARVKAAALETRSNELQTQTNELIEQQRDGGAQRLALEEQNRELARLSEAKSAFLAAISHELRTPLNAVIGFAELLAEGVAGPVNEGQAEYLGDIRTSGSHLLRLINDILDYSKLEAGKLELKTEIMTLGPPVREAVDMLRANAQRKGIALTAALEENVLVEGDELRLKQIALNLVANAVKFTPRGGTVTVTLTKRSAVATLTVKDTGVGIDPAYHQAIFEAFRQVEGNGTDRRFEGTGLGLALVKRLLEPMRGSVRVESAVGQGATFIVELARAFPSRVMLDPTAGTRGADVLVAEDDDATRHLISRVLQANRCQVRQAGNGQRALEALAERLPDVLVLDLMMPELDGYAVLERLRALPGGAAVRVLVFSASEPALDNRALLERLGAQILVKGTVATQELVSAVAQLARQHASSRTAA
jgi:signal transduction histidine kinase/CheY-like chemotaxis protein